MPQAQVVLLGIAFGLVVVTALVAFKKKTPEQRTQEQTGLTDRDQARRLARAICADIALYNKELVEEARRSGTQSDGLRAEIAEGGRCSTPAWRRRCAGCSTTRSRRCSAARTSAERGLRRAIRVVILR